MQSKYKLIFFIIALVTTSVAFAQPPTHYELHGDNLKISYSTTSFSGKPLLSYNDGNKIKNFSGEEIRTIGTEVGTLVTVTIRKTSNSGSTTFTVLIPKINIDSKDIYFQTEGITTRHKLSINPSLSFGQIDSNKFTSMKGIASLFYY